MHSKTSKSVLKKLPCEMRKNVNLRQSPFFTIFFCELTNGFAYWQCWELPGPVKPMVSAAKASALPWRLSRWWIFPPQGCWKPKKKPGVVFFVVGGTYLNEVRRSYFFLRNRFLQGLGSKNFPQKSLEWNLTQFQWRWTVALERSQKSGEGTFCLVESLIVTLWNTNTT